MEGRRKRCCAVELYGMLWCVSQDSMSADRLEIISYTFGKTDLFMHCQIGQRLNVYRSFSKHGVISVLQWLGSALICKLSSTEHWSK